MTGAPSEAVEVLEAALPLGLGLRERMTPDQINEAQARAEARWPGAQDTQ